MKFECKKCGQCCKEFCNEVGKSSKILGLPLFEWEKKEFEEIAKKRGIKLNIEPTDLIFDKKSNIYWCVQFSLKQPSCPFLKDNLCSIYEKRPIICRSFPIAKNPFALKEDESSISLSFIHCHNFNFKEFFNKELGLEAEKLSELKTDFVIKKYLDIFGEEVVVYNIISNNIKKFIDKTIKMLIENKKVKFRKVSKFDLHKYSPTPFFEFLEKIGMCDENSKKIIIEKLMNYEDVKKNIESREKL